MRVGEAAETDGSTTRGPSRGPSGLRVIADTHRHAGHADIVRGLIDGAVGMSKSNDSMPPGDKAWWEDHRSRLERVAQEAAQEAGRDA